MAEIHFRSMGASQNKSDVTNRFVDRNFVLASFTCFLCNSDCFEVIRNFRSSKIGGNPFPVDGDIAEQKWRHHSIPGWRFSYSLCRNFPSILFRSKVIQEFHAFAMVIKIFQFLGATMTPKFLEISTPQKVE
jgi:hypothetical protein